VAEELTDLTGLGSTTEEKLNSIGIESLDDLAQVEPEVVEDKDISVGVGRMEGFVKQAQQESVQILSGSDVVDEYQSRYSLETGIEPLDENLGGGFLERQIVALGGDTGSGKTQFAFFLAGQAVKETGNPALYIETEPDRYTGDRVSQMFDDSVQSQVYKVAAHGLDQQKLAYREARDVDTDFSCIIVDSFTSRFRLSDKFEDRSSFQERNQEFREHLNLIEEMANDCECPVLMTCQIYKNPTQYGTTNVIYGSSLMMHMVSFVLMMKSKGGQLTEMNIRNHPRMGDSEVQLQITDGGLRFAE